MKPDIQRLVWKHTGRLGKELTSNDNLKELTRRETTFPLFFYQVTRKRDGKMAAPLYHKYLFSAPYQTGFGRASASKSGFWLFPRLRTGINPLLSTWKPFGLALYRKKDAIEKRFEVCK